MRDATSDVRTHFPHSRSQQQQLKAASFLASCCKDIVTSTSLQHFAPFLVAGFFIGFQYPIYFIQVKGSRICVGVRGMKTLDDCLFCHQQCVGYTKAFAAGIVTEEEEETCIEIFMQKIQKANKRQKESCSFLYWRKELQGEKLTISRLGILHLAISKQPAFAYVRPSEPHTGL